MDERFRLLFPLFIAVLRWVAALSGYFRGNSRHSFFSLASAVLMRNDGYQMRGDS
jgi:hypothetical protein